MKHLGWMVTVIVLFVGCAGPRKAEVRPLDAPAGTTEAVSRQLEQGNQLLLKQDWAGARDAYLAAIQADQMLAEAHYNLALALEKLGEKADARKHYVAAANLAPGNKVIWDAPPLRKYDGELTLGKKSWMDANPK